MEAKPVLDRKAAEQIHLNVIKRMDPDVEELLANSAHVALYDFDIPTKKWSRKDIEGSLFLVKRRSSPRFRFIILNKKSAANHIEDVDGGFQCEVNKPYCLYRSQEGGVVGIWFYEEADCDRISALLQRISSTFAAPSAALAGAATNVGSPRSPFAPIAPAVQQQQQQQQQQQYHSVPSTLTTAMSAASAGEETVGGDDFWDRKVKVPDNLPAPGPASRSLGTSQPATNGGETGNALAKVFAGMKVATTAAAPVAPQAPMALPLLTPQFLQQQAQQPPAASAGAALLEGLRGGGTTNVATVTGGGGSGGGGNSLEALLTAASSSLTSGNAPEGAGESATSTGKKVQALLRGLSNNSEFCGMLAGEMKRAGLL